MSLFPRRAPLVEQRARTRSRRSRAALAGLGSLTMALTAASCGMEVQTTNPYTPAIGVNFDVGDVQIRDLMILSRTPGQGFLSGTLTSYAEDTLIGVSGNAYKSDGSDGSALNVTVQPVKVVPATPVVLTKRPLLNVASADLEAGLTAKMVLRFAKAGEVTTNAPVVDANLPQYASIGPSASPSASG